MYSVTSLHRISIYWKTSLVWSYDHARLSRLKLPPSLYNEMVFEEGTKSPEVYYWCARILVEQKIYKGASVLASLLPLLPFSPGRGAAPATQTHEHSPTYLSTFPTFFGLTTTKTFNTLLHTHLPRLMSFAKELINSKQEEIEATRWKWQNKRLITVISWE